ncbi:MAG: recombinase family protein [Acidobacteria bacterium]|nr:recombinase family protein [Acidobacteriota bacterium]
MSNAERVRERLSGVPSSEYFEVRMRAGWNLVAVEWERMADDQPIPREEVPYGMRVAGDCQHLEYAPDEMAVLTLMMELILQEHGFGRIAMELNDHGFRRRNGVLWTEISAFNMLPRLIEIGPRMFSTTDWHERRDRIYKLLGH